MERKELIERLKNNWIVFAGLTEEEQEIIRINKPNKKVLLLGENMFEEAPDNLFCGGNNIYRLKPDFKEE